MQLEDALGGSMLTLTRALQVHVVTVTTLYVTLTKACTLGNKLSCMQSCERTAWHLGALHRLQHMQMFHAKHNNPERQVARLKCTHFLKTSSHQGWYSAA